LHTFVCPADGNNLLITIASSKDRSTKTKGMILEFR
jgi:hypothetical protein